MTQKVLWINRVNVVMSNLIFTGISADNNSVFENHSILINWGFSTIIEEQWELSNRERVIVWLAWATSGHVTDGLEISTFGVTALSEITSTAFHKKLDFSPLTSTNIKLKRFVFFWLFLAQMQLKLFHSGWWNGSGQRAQSINWCVQLTSIWTSLSNDKSSDKETLSHC